MAIRYLLDLDGDTRPHPGAGVPVKDHLRAAWRWAANGSVEVNIAEGRECVRKHLREIRDEEWPWIDAERAKATDADDTARLANIRTYAQALRDAPTHASIDGATTADELRGITLASVAGPRPS